MGAELRNEAGERLDACLTPGASFEGAVVVIGHGVTANMDREWARVLAAGLGAAGVTTLRFSFSGNGESEGSFLDSCPTKEAADLEAAFDWLEGQGARRLFYVGHSMGAAVGVMVAAREPRLEGLVSLAGMVHTADFAQRKFGEQPVGASLMWDKPECPLGQVFMDDMQAIGSVLPLASRVSVPWLLVHGTEDTVVPMQESEAIAQAAPASSAARLELIHGADHVFSGEAAGQMAERVTKWFLEQSGAHAKS